MARVLMVSKPVVEPWNDSGKNLVRDLAGGLRRHRPTLMLPDRASCPVEGADVLRVYPSAIPEGFALRRVDQARVMGRLLVSRGHDLWHFFFAPNPPALAAGRLCRAVRRKPVIHTVCSAPRDARAVVSALFADVHVVLSRHTAERLEEAGLPADRMRRIPPMVSLPDGTLSHRAALGRQARHSLGIPAAQPYVLYPGDLEFGGGARCMLSVARALADRGVALVMACRAKTAAAAQVARELQAEGEPLTRRGLLYWAGNTSHIHGLLAAAEVVCLPSRELYAKMDYPLVLLEAMALSIPVVVAAGGAAAELAESGGALVCEPRAEPLCDVLLGLLEDERARSLQGQAGCARAAADFSPGVVAQVHERLYDSLI